MDATSTILSQLIQETISISDLVELHVFSENSVISHIVLSIFNNLKKHNKALKDVSPSSIVSLFQKGVIPEELSFLCPKLIWCGCPSYPVCSSHKHHCLMCKNPCCILTPAVTSAQYISLLKKNQSIMSKTLDSISEAQVTLEKERNSDREDALTRAAGANKLLETLTSVDSRIQAVKSWETLVKILLKCIKNEKPVLSQHPPEKNIVQKILELANNLVFRDDESVCSNEKIMKTVFFTPKITHRPTHATKKRLIENAISSIQDTSGLTHHHITDRAISQLSTYPISWFPCVFLVMSETSPIFWDHLIETIAKQYLLFYTKQRVKLSIALEKCATEQISIVSSKTSTLTASIERLSEVLIHLIKTHREIISTITWASRQMWERLGPQKRNPDIFSIISDTITQPDMINGLMLAPYADMVSLLPHKTSPETVMHATLIQTKTQVSMSVLLPQTVKGTTAVTIRADNAQDSANKFIVMFLDKDCLTEKSRDCILRAIRRISQQSQRQQHAQQSSWSDYFFGGNDVEKIHLKEPKTPILFVSTAHTTAKLLSSVRSFICTLPEKDQQPYKICRKDSIKAGLFWAVCKYHLTQNDNQASIPSSHHV
jgi:hypothetical protein